MAINVSSQVQHRCRSVGVEVGFEPTDELPHHTLSRTAYRHPALAASVPHLRI